MQPNNLVLLLVAAILPTVAGHCTVHTAPCTFSCGNKMLDLSPLIPGNDKAKFLDVIDSDGAQKYSFSPCSTFSEGAGCTNVSVCQVDPLTPTNTIPVGDLSSMQLSDANQDAMTLTYQHTDAKKVLRKAVVTLQCSNADDSLAIDVDSTGSGRTTYTMTLTSKHACLFSPSDTTSAPATTAPANVTTAQVTTASANVTTAQVTTAPANVTTAPADHNVTTAHITTAPAGHNVTTAHLTTAPAHHNVTTARAGNVTVVTTAPARVTTAGNNVTSVVTTSPSHVDTTTHGLASVTRSAGWLIAVLAVVVWVAV